MAKQQNGLKNGSKKSHGTTGESASRMIKLKLVDGKSVTACQSHPFKQFKAVVGSKSGLTILAHVQDDDLDKGHDIEILTFQDQGDGTFVEAGIVSYFLNDKGQLTKASRSLEAPHQEPIALSG